MIIDTRTKVLFVLTVLLASALIIFRDPLFCRQIYETRNGENVKVIGSTCDQDREFTPLPEPSPTFRPEDLTTV